MSVEVERHERQHSIPALLPKVLIVIPTLGTRLSTLGRTIRSVVNQEGVHVDVVMVCKESSAELLQIADAFGVRLLVDSGNLSQAINIGLRTATEHHRYFNWLGDDDVARPGAFAAAVERLESSPGSVLCFGACDYIDLQGNLKFNRRPSVFAATAIQFVPGLIKQEACLFRLSAVLQVGGLDPTLRYTMDLDLILKLRRLGKFERLARTQAGFCWHPGSITIANRRASLMEAQQVQAASLHGLTAVVYKALKRPIAALILLANQALSR